MYKLNIATGCKNFKPKSYVRRLKIMACQSCKIGYVCEWRVFAEQVTYAATFMPYVLYLKGRHY